MKKTIKDIINESEDLHFIKIYKPNKRDRSTWTFTVIDSTSDIAGISDYLSNYKFQIVTLRRGNHYFLSYKIYFDDKFEYFVDTRKSNHRANTSEYVESTIDYMVYSNDISIMKNDSSFKFTRREMNQKHIDNFLDLCAYFGEYSAIGTGITRDIRNLIVMDIDVDCTKESNQTALNELLIKFGKYNSLPDFYIFNNESKHVQLQWLIKNLKYKDIDNNVKSEIIENLLKDKNKSKEINLSGTEFLKLTNNGIAYRLYTLALTDIVPKHKFGDKNYTFWKAKNFYSAYKKLYNLELKVPLYDGHEIYYMTQEEMDNNFSTKEGRCRYYDEAPDLNDITKKTEDLVGSIIKKMIPRKKKEIENIKDEETSIVNTEERSNKGYAKSRNSFVLVCSRETTWELARKSGFKSTDDIRKMSQYELDLFKKKVFRTVKKRFKDEDKKYNGHWPDTTNNSKYHDSEFDVTFNGSFNFAISNFKYTGWSSEQRIKSANTRSVVKDIKLYLVDYIRLNNKKISRNDLLNEANRILTSSGQKKISLTSLNRYIKQSKNMTSSDRTNLYNYIVNEKKNNKININIIKYINGENI